jgi:large subunit ribosomal protein L25
MSQDLELKVDKRQPRTAVEGVRGIVYGSEHPSQPITATPLELERLYQVAGHNRLFDLMIEGEKPVKVLFQEVQRHPVSHQIIHFDLNAISLKEKLQTGVPVHIVGESPIVIAKEGILTTVTDTIEVEAEPLALPENFEIDISNLTEVEDHITVGELKAPAGVEILTDPELIVVKIDAVIEQVTEEELAEEAALAEAQAEAEGEEGEAGSAEASEEGSEEAAGDEAGAADEASEAPKDKEE